MNDENKRRNFLKVILSATAGIGLLSSFQGKTKPSTSEKVKMLTPDGKLVEIDKSLLGKEIISSRASNAELLEWMNSKNIIQDGR